MEDLRRIYWGKPKIGIWEGPLLGRDIPEKECLEKEERSKELVHKRDMSRPAEERNLVPIQKESRLGRSKKDLTKKRKEAFLQEREGSEKRKKRGGVVGREGESTHGGNLETGKREKPAVREGRREIEPWAEGRI